MKWHSSTREECLRQLHSSGTNGLSGEEARKRLEEKGKNPLTPPKPESLLHRFFRQFSDTMVLILLAAAVVVVVVVLRKRWKARHTPPKAPPREEPKDPPETP